LLSAIGVGAGVLLRQKTLIQVASLSQELRRAVGWKNEGIACPRPAASWC